MLSLLVTLSWLLQAFLAVTRPHQLAGNFSSRSADLLTQRKWGIRRVCAGVSTAQTFINTSKTLLFPLQTFTRARWVPQHSGGGPLRVSGAPSPPLNSFFNRQALADTKLPINGNPFTLFGVSKPESVEQQHDTNRNSGTLLPTNENSSTHSPEACFGRFSSSTRDFRAEPDVQRLASLCRSLAIAAPSCSLYGGLRGVLDYGVAGSALLENLRVALKKHFTCSPCSGDFWDDNEGLELEVIEGAPKDESETLRNSVFLVETAAIGPTSLWRHSGHLDLFNDEAVQCADTGQCFRMDSLVYRPPNVEAGETDFQVALTEELDNCHSKKARTEEKGQAARAAAAPAYTPQLCAGSAERTNGQTTWIPLCQAPLSLYPELPSPVTGRVGALRPPRPFDLMLQVPLKSHVPGSSVSGSSKARLAEHHEIRAGGEQASEAVEDVAILRPETAQNVFVAYRGLTPDALHAKLPFGLAQEGRVYRNECQGTRSCFLLRLREFRQFEIEYFISPNADTDALLSQWTEHIRKFFISLGIPCDTLEAQEKEKYALPHYASRCIDFSYLMRSRNDEGNSTESLKEICGLALRGDYDLCKHQNASRENLEFRQHLRDQGDAKSKTAVNVLPHVIETSIGIDRLLFAALHSALTKDNLLGRTRVYLNLHPALAPYKAAVFPIVASNPELNAAARKLFNHLRKHFFVLWDSSGSLGRRYRKADELGVPFCLSLDDDSIRQKTVKIRWRNTGAQLALPWAKASSFLRQRCCSFS